MGKPYEKAFVYLSDTEVKFAQGDYMSPKA